MFAASVLVISATPLIASAALVPDCVLQGGLSCQLCDVVSLVQSVINFLIVLAIPIATALFTYAGFLYATAGIRGKSGDVSEARSIFSTAMLGFVIAISGWLVINTLLHVLTQNNASFQSQNWFSIECVSQSQRTTDSSIGTVLGNLVTGTSGTSGAGGSSGSSGSGQLVQIDTVGTNGASLSVGFNATLPDSSLLAGYTAADTYNAQISSACNSYGSNIPNCQAVVTSLISAESSGNPQTGCNGAQSCGIMQLSSSAGGQSCDPSDISCISTQINKGVSLLSNNYSQFSNTPNALAAYNSGATTVAGQSASGKNSAMVASRDCSGAYAWQCATNPGGLTETQGYVANICQTLSLKGVSCK